MCFLLVLLQLGFSRCDAESKEIMTHPITGEEKRCFFSNGFIFCTFIVRKDGTIVLPKNGDWLRFPSGNRYAKKKENETTETLVNSSNEKASLASRQKEA